MVERVESMDRSEEVKKWWGDEGLTAPDIKIDFMMGGKYSILHTRSRSLRSCE